MEHFKKSNKYRSNLLTIIDQELKLSHLQTYFKPKISTLIESFRIEFQESFNCTQTTSACVQIINSQNNHCKNTIETQSETSTCITRTSINKSIIKENKQILRSICFNLRLKHPIIQNKIKRRTVALKTEIVNKKMMTKFRETIIQQGELRKKNKNKGSKIESDFLVYDDNQTEGNIFEL